MDYKDEFEKETGKFWKGYEGSESYVDPTYVDWLETKLRNQKKDILDRIEEKIKEELSDKWGPSSEFWEIKKILKEERE
jgi:hypothetical protein